MRIQRLHRFTLLLILASIAVQALAADEPKKDAKPAAAATTSDLHRQTLKGFIYFSIRVKTNFQKIGDTIGANIPELKKAAAAAHAQVEGPMIFIYHGATADPSSDFEMEIGYPITEKVADAGNFKVREVPEFPCVSVLYTGPISAISSAYEKLFTGVATQSLKVTDETREMVLYFEGPDSPNNIAHVSVGVK